MLRSSEVEAVKVHYLVPRRYKVVQELLLGVLTTIDFRDGPELGVRTEDEVDTGAGPLEFARCAITTLEHVAGFRVRLPRRAHVEQVHEEVIGERFWPMGEDAVLGLSDVCIQDAHAADENRHLRRGQRHELSPIDQHLFRRYLDGFPNVVAEAVCCRFQHSDGVDIGLLLRRVRTARREGNRHVMPGLLRSGFNGCAAAENDEVSE